MEVTLYQPQIPQNVGSIARTCAATAIKLNLIRPFPFDISAKAVKRAGLDYWPLVKLEVFESWEDYWRRNKDKNHWIIETCGNRSLFEVRLHLDDVLVFGKETTGVSEEVIDCIGGNGVVFIPVLKNTVRSLNLSNCVAIAVYECLRQQEFRGF